MTVEAPAAVSFAGAICAPAATFGGDGSRRSEDSGAVETVVASRHWLRPLEDRIGEYRCGVAADVNLVTRAGRPPPLYIAQYDGGPPTM
jgi:hypothetical protein